MNRPFATVLLFLLLLTYSPWLAAGEPEKGAAAAEVTGRVLLDANRSDKVDEGDRGLANVLVSDGIQFVRTAADGSFTLKFMDDPLIPYQPAQVLSVSWPSGTWPVGQRFFVRRSDIKAGERVDFLLQEQKQTLPFTFAQGTDPHDNLACARELFGDDLNRMGSRVSFCLMTGDLGYADRKNADAMFSAILDATRRFPVPMLHTCGNHDICDIHSTRWSEQHPLAGYGPYTKYLGPIRYSFNHADIHFVGLDWARITEGGKLETGVPDTVIDWLKKDLGELKPGTRTFVYMHHHFRHGDSKFWDVLAEHKVELLLAGHSHRNKEESHRGVQFLTTQNLCGPYRLVTVQEKGHAIVNRCYAGNASGHRHSYAGKCKMTLDAAAFKTRHGTHRELADRKVEGVHALEGFQADQLEIVADIEPGSAKKFGIRLLQGEEKIDLAIHAADDVLHFGDVQTSAVRGRGDKHYRLRFVLADGKARLYASNRVQIEQAMTFKQPGAVQLFAEGGQAVFTRADVWEIRAERK